MDKKNVFNQMKEQAERLDKKMLAIEICQMEKSLKETKHYLLKLSMLPELLEVTKVGFLKCKYHSNYYTMIQFEE